MDARQVGHIVVAFAAGKTGAGGPVELKRDRSDRVCHASRRVASFGGERDNCTARSARYGTRRLFDFVIPVSWHVSLLQFVYGTWVRHRCAFFNPPMQPI